MDLGQQPIAAQRPVRIRHGLGNQSHILCKHAPRGIRLEQVGGIGQGDAPEQLGVHVDGQIELRGPGVEVEPVEAQALQARRRHGRIRDVEQHLHHGRMARAAVRQLLDQALEGEILVGEGLQGCLAHAGEQL